MPGGSVRRLPSNTPIDEQLSEITLVFIPTTPGNTESTAQFGKALTEHISREIEQDVPIWENKEYAEHPLLTRGDGPIATWRSCCQKFYADMI